MRILLLALLIGAAPATAAPSHLEAALAAHARGDYAAAHAALVPLAARGSPVAEALLGGMAARGQGGPANPATAVAWWLRSAERGYASAQLALARALAQGRGVSADPGEAWLWANRAARAGGEAGTQAKALAQSLAKKLPPETCQNLLKKDEAWQVRP